MYEENCGSEKPKVELKSLAIPDAMDHLNESISVLEKKVCSLREKLDPILQPMPGEEQGERLQDSPTNLAVRIRQSARDIEIISGIVSKIHKELEI